MSTVVFLHCDGVISDHRDFVNEPDDLHLLSAAVYWILNDANLISWA